jgi:hypothetical protein
VDPTRIALLSNAPGVVFGQVGHAARGLLIGLFLLGASQVSPPALVIDAGAVTPAAWSLPCAPDRAVASPPPRSI